MSISVHGTYQERYLTTGGYNNAGDFNMSGVVIPTIATNIPYFLIFVYRGGATRIAPKISGTNIPLILAGSGSYAVDVYGYQPSSAGTITVNVYSAWQAVIAIINKCAGVELAGSSTANQGDTQVVTNVSPANSSEMYISHTIAPYGGSPNPPSRTSAIRLAGGVDQTNFGHNSSMGVDSFGNQGPHFACSWKLSSAADSMSQSAYPLSTYWNYVKYYQSVFRVLPHPEPTMCQAHFIG